MKDDNKVVSIHNGEQYYKSAKDLFKEVEKQKFTRFITLILDEEGTGMLYKYGMTNPEANYELDQIKLIFLAQGN